MKASAEVAIVIILALIGTAVAAYSYTQLQQKDVLFDENSIRLGGQSYQTWEVGYIPGNIFNIFTLRMIGSVDSVGTGVDFYLVNDTNWNSWSTDIGLRSALSVVHLNSDVLSSQSGGQFSLAAPLNNGDIIVLVNNEYPNVNNASVNVNIALQYTSLFNFCDFVAGLVLLGIAIVLLTVMIRKKARALAQNP